MMYDIAIIGGGCAGFGAAMYAGRFQMKTVIFADNLGGTITLTDVVENYPGFKRLTGGELADKLIEHAKDYDIDVIEEKVADVKKKGSCFILETEDGKKFASKTVLFATGTIWRKLGVAGEKEFANKGVHYCALCLPPDEEIVSNSNILKISDVTPMTRVLTVDGTYKPVCGFTRREYKGNLIQIKPRFFTEPVLLTPEHPVLTLRVKKGIGVDYWKDFKFGEPRWAEAQHLTENDCVVYPIPKEVKDIESLRLSDILDIQLTDNGMVLPHKKTHTAKEIVDIIEVTPDFVRLAGYYLAEGSASRHALIFYFGSHENNYVEDVCCLMESIFGLKPEKKIVEGGSVCAVTVYSKIAADFFKALFGKYSFEKNIPHWMTLLPYHKQKELVKGFWRGDGTMREKDFTAVTSSRKLAYQLRDILLRLGIIPSIHKRGMRSLNKKKHFIQGRDISFKHDKYHIVAGGQFIGKMSQILEQPHPFLQKRARYKQHAWINSDTVILPIREIKEVNYEGIVLSLAVEENNSFVAKNFVVHNCDGMMYKNKIIGVVGGSDSAAKEALLLSEYGKKVYIIYRGDKIRPEPVN
ncbi:MAG: FAD-dependent oxidoreductase, partial [Candidatus Aenigmarchaeota archaeon]|nr:FAD-dependent oxidoreductase [Candidatus Aenigmarchaeota archaeon]MDI6722156.1 FAD-dependent oxidoreductase [Candidatus Aenigmarchaeota archaeon]